MTGKQGDVIGREMGGVTEKRNREGARRKQRGSDKKLGKDIKINEIM